MASDVSAQARALVARRAHYRCEYCHLHEDDSGYLHEVDHIISRKHGGSSSPDNLALACIACNRYKGTDVASVRPGRREAIRLFDPRRDDWATHFKLSDGFLEPLSETGEVTIRLLQLNIAERVSERRILARLGRYLVP